MNEELLFVKMTMRKINRRPITIAAVAACPTKLYT